jgi:hypothetical protein
MSDDFREPAVLRTVRALLLAILAVGMLGTALDLVLLEHYEDAWQMPPLVMIALGLAALAWTALGGRASAVLGLRIVMILFVATGALGLVVHFTGNREFQLEMDPTLSGWALFSKVIHAKAPPALAPGVMIQLGLIGLLYTYRHPGLDRAPRLDGRF